MVFPFNILIPPIHLFKPSILPPEDEERKCIENSCITQNTMFIITGFHFFSVRNIDAIWRRCGHLFIPKNVCFTRSYCSNTDIKTLHFTPQKEIRIFLKYMSYIAIFWHKNISIHHYIKQTK